MTTTRSLSIQSGNPSPQLDSLLLLLIPLALALVMGFPAHASGDGETAWDRLSRLQPTALKGVSSRERQILQALTPDQADAYLDGVEPDAITLANGETLDRFIDRLERRAAAGLVYVPLERACLLADTRRLQPALTTERSRSFTARGGAVDYSSQGGTPDGCELPELAGEIFRTNPARALFLDVEVFEAEGPGGLKIWPGRGYPEPETDLVDYDLTAEGGGLRRSVIAMLCDEESLEPCAEGDFDIRMSGARAQFRISALGYFKPAGGLAAEKPHQEGEEDEGEEADGAEKNHQDWHPVGDHDIAYTEGKVGVGTASPESPLHLVSPNESSGTNGILKISTKTGQVAVADGNKVGGSIYENLVLDGNEIDSDAQLRVNANSGENVILGWRSGTGTFGGGNVGIGTQGPDRKLHVQGRESSLDGSGNSVGGAVMITSTQLDGGNLQNLVIDGNEIDSDAKLHLNRNSKNDVILVDQGGRVGIGTASPDAELHVSTSGSGDDHADIRLTAKSDVKVLIDADAGGSSHGGRFGTFSAHDMVLYSDGQRRIVLEADGDICIGDC